MTLLEIRTKFITTSGRFDLVVDTTDYVDNGADYFINAGLRLLDTLQDSKKSILRYQRDVAANQTILEVPSARAIKEVWAMNADGRFLLEKKDLGWIKENYPEPVADQTAGAPSYWAPAVIGLQVDQETLTAGAGVSVYTGQFTYDFEDIMFVDEGSHYTYNGILFAPKADETYTLTVYGKFWSKLSANAKKNYWSEEWPELVVMAAQWALEAHHRNTEGMNDWMGSIQTLLGGEDKDLVESDIAGINQIGG